MIKRDLGHGFYAVPRVVVTENGIPSVRAAGMREHRRQQYEELKKEFGDDA